VVRKSAKQSDNTDNGATDLHLIANSLALLATKDMGQGDKIVMLKAVGFGNQAIASLVGTDPNTVKVTISQRKKAGKKRSKKVAK
jgi:hypothetical protein